MPLATISASWLLIAEWAGQSTFGRGVKNLSRLSVCSSISPGSSQPPSPSSASGRLLGLSAKARMTPPSISSDPCTTSSSSTSFTLLIIMLLFPSDADDPLRGRAQFDREKCRQWPHRALSPLQSAPPRRHCFWHPATRSVRRVTESDNRR
ncbi:hypothetical protein SDC9_211692 [bioreactor metagenome]|uniref:Uncharacterized protein n=1 Tax=bioreactor metagenome TaxID=1076179 RepID=A0A645JJT4_9ZZZZ